MDKNNKQNTKAKDVKVKSKAAKSKAAKSKAVKSKAVKSKAVKSKAVKSKAAKPKAKPKTAKPKPNIKELQSIMPDVRLREKYFNKRIKTYNKLKEIDDNLHRINRYFLNDYEKTWDIKYSDKLSKIKRDGALGMSNRIKKLAALKYKYYYNSMDTIMIMFNITNHTTAQSSNFGSMMCESVDTIKPLIKKSKIRLNRNITDDIGRLYYSASPSYVSCDGEYRSGINQYESLHNAITKNLSLVNELNEYIFSVSEKRNWLITSNYFYPTMKHSQDQTVFEYGITSTRFAYLILTISWFCSIYDHINNNSVNHMNESYKEIILGYLDIDTLFVKKIIKKYESNKIIDFIGELSQDDMVLWNGVNIRAKNPLKCGYKMIPLNIKDVQDPLKIRYPSWREYFISTRLNDLVINNINPGFSIILDWFYIKNTRKGLYDNTSQEDKIKHSNIARDILNNLRNAQRGTYFAAENLDSLTKSSDDIKKWISSKFRNLFDKITDPIDYNVEHILISEVTLAFLNEDVGRTLVDNIKLIKINPELNKSLGYPFESKGIDYFAKYMFEICYGFATLHSVAGVIHADPHLNNITIGKLHANAEVGVKDKYSAYIIDDDYQFVFPVNGYNASIIDFSRSIIDVEKHEDFKDKGLPKSYVIFDDYDEFLIDEVNKLLNLLVKIFPSVKNKRDELFIICKNNYSVVFKFLSALDIYIFISKMKTYLSLVTQRISKEAIDLVDKIYVYINTTITAGLSALVNNQLNSIVDMEYPAISVLKNMFVDYIDGNKFGSKLLGGVVIDVFNLSNVVEYSLAKHEFFPDTLTKVKYVDENGKLKDFPKMENYRKDIREEMEATRVENLEMLNYIAMRYKQRL